MSWHHPGLGSLIPARLCSASCGVQKSSDLALKTKVLGLPFW